MERAPAGNRARFVIYTIVKRERDGKSAWVRIGDGLPNRDGSISGFLDAVPTNGRIHIREARPFEASSTPLRPANGPPQLLARAASDPAE